MFLISLLEDFYNFLQIDKKKKIDHIDRASLVLGVRSLLALGSVPPGSSPSPPTSLWPPASHRGCCTLPAVATATAPACADVTTPTLLAQLPIHAAVLLKCHQDLAGDSCVPLLVHVDGVGGPQVVLEIAQLRPVLRPSLNAKSFRLRRQARMASSCTSL